MTHEELLMKLFVLGPEETEQTHLPKVNAALRAVLEFHKPWAMETGPEDDPETETLMGCECIPQLPAFLNPWPCPTVQIIEEALSNG